MGQTATSITEQIQLLKDRGMVFDSEEEKVNVRLFFVDLD